VWKSEDDVETSCKHELECDFSDSEDSKPFKDRPFYKSEFWISSGGQPKYNFIDKNIKQNTAKT
jgi:hypothetical protein